MSLPFYILDVFAESSYAGNQLAVFRHAADLDSATMQQPGPRDQLFRDHFHPLRRTQATAASTCASSPPPRKCPSPVTRPWARRTFIRQSHPGRQSRPGGAEPEGRADPGVLRPRRLLLDEAGGAHFRSKHTSCGKLAAMLGLEPCRRSTAAFPSRKSPRAALFHRAATDLDRAEKGEGGPRQVFQLHRETQKPRASWCSAPKRTSRATGSASACSSIISACPKTRPPAAATAAWPATWCSSATSAGPHRSPQRAGLRNRPAFAAALESRAARG